MQSSFTPRVGVAALSSPMEVGAGRAPQVFVDLSRLLTQSGCDVIELGSIVTADAALAAGRKLAEAHVDAVVLAPASWFEDYLVLDVIEECNRPVLFWPQPGMETGALCGTQQATCYLKQLNQPALAVFGPLEAGRNLDRGMAFLRAAALFRRLRRMRLGLTGQRVRGMSEVAVNEFALKKTVGPRVVPVDMVGLIASARAAGQAEKAENMEPGQVIGRDCPGSR